MNLTRLGILLSSLLAVVACGNDRAAVPEHSSHAPSGDAGQGSSSAQPKDSGLTPERAGVAVTGKVVEFVAATMIEGPVIPGVKVCVYEHPEVPCVTSDDGGAFSIGGVPMHSETGLTFVKEGYRSSLHPVATEDADIAMPDWAGGVLLRDEAAAGLFRGRAPFDPSRGAVTLSTVQPGARFYGLFDWVLGVGVSVSPAGGTGPIYLDTAEQPLASATETSGGIVIWADLDPGMYVATFDAAQGSCSSLPNDSVSTPAIYGYPGTAPNAVRFPVATGFTTSPVTVWCPDGTGSATLLSGHDGGAP